MDANEIARIRRDLGLASEAGTPGAAARRAFRRRSTPAEINRAILQLNANAVSILSGRDSGGLAEDGDTATPR